jgi:pyruvate dehydrogenase phosphatase
VFKLPAAFTSTVFQVAIPPAIARSKLAEWLPRNITPPYLSNCASVHHHLLHRRGTDDKLPADLFLIMCSDGLTAVYPKANNNINHWVQAVGSAIERGESPALALLWQALGGDADTVSQYMTLESTEKWMDDTTIAVLEL